MNGQTFDSRHTQSGTPDFAVDNGEIAFSIEIHGWAQCINTRKTRRKAPIRQSILSQSLVLFFMLIAEFSLKRLECGNSTQRVFVHLGDSIGEFGSRLPQTPA